ncbi:MAG: RNA polymerase sigma factor, partial [Planctomycetota bacterium]
MMDPNATDEQLLSAFVDGDREALGELARRHEQALLGLARGLLGGQSASALDAVQETWMRVIRYGSSFNGRSTVKTWLYRIAVNRCRDLRATRQLGMQAAETDHTTDRAPDGASMRQEV